MISFSCHGQPVQHSGVFQTRFTCHGACYMTFWLSHKMYKRQILCSSGIFYAPTWNNAGPVWEFQDLIIWNLDCLALSVVINPNWHELWKQQKWSSLAPPRRIFHKTQWAWQSVKITRLMSIFTSKKFYKNSADKFWSKKDRRREVPWLLTCFHVLSSHPDKVMILTPF